MRKSPHSLTNDRFGSIHIHVPLVLYHRSYIASICRPTTAVIDDVGHVGAYVNAPTGANCFISNRRLVFKGCERNALYYLVGLAEGGGSPQVVVMVEVLFSPPPDPYRRNTLPHISSVGSPANLLQ